ncbi:spore coat polysaccharide biosynthesis protein SpsF [Rhizomicrobium palustre]|uniref:Spore coat polysaccharide biosynthesis protein SpsF n=1 Tax=Rhizomicrobium palustre TaxID=189966 RepID=A0A846MWZ5_9PROT|nr:NTP transferase domain-containing protein [Rhizomicrobium palustre]NIK88064.1 spore coat polysaccharide biosynthesis protein SpsF [Rhizomicrobium palustre]
MNKFETPRVVAVIQARMGSTRFPGKVLKPIAGKPLLWHVVHRLEKSRWINEIVVATSVNPRDDALVEYCKAEGTRVVRGPEFDVLSRFARAAELTDADVIVRVCSDSPFIDAGYTDHLIDAMLDQACDFVQLEEGAVTAHEGIDVFSRHGLDKLMMDVAEDPVAREHVAGYFRLHMDFVPVARAKPYPALAKEVGRLSVDTPDDLTFMEAVHERLHAKAGEATLADLLLLLEREPSLRKINAHVRQKGIAPEGGLVLIRCDSEGEAGAARVRRMIDLARALRDRQSIGVTFALTGSEQALAAVQAAGFEAERLASPDAPMAALSRHPDILVLDGGEGLSRSDTEALDIAYKVAIEDYSDRRLACDEAFYPPLPQAQALTWSGSKCRVHTGWEWSLSGHAPAGSAVRPASPVLSLLVITSDALVGRLANALQSLDPVFRARFVLGADCKDRDRLARSIVRLAPNFETVEGANGLATEFTSSDAALVCFGPVAYDLAAAGIPAVYLSQNESQSGAAAAFEGAGMGISLGLSAQDKLIAQAVWSLLNDSARRREMRAAGLMTIDGLGVTRVATALSAALTAHREHHRAVS